MKKKIRYVLLGILITIILIIIYGIINTYISRKEIIHIKYYDGYDNTMNELSKKIDKISSNRCRSSINRLKSRIDDTNYKNNITIKEYYDNYFKDSMTFLNYYQNVVDECNLNNTDYIYVKVLDSEVFPYYIKNKYDLIHEITFKDYNLRNNLISYEERGSYTNKIDELDVLNNLLDEVLNEKD